MNYVYLLLEYFWGDFDLRQSRVKSAHLTRDSAELAATSLGLAASPPEDGGNWFEIHKVRLFDQTKA